LLGVEQLRPAVFNDVQVDVVVEDGLVNAVAGGFFGEHSSPGVDDGGVAPTLELVRVAGVSGARADGHEGLAVNGSSSPQQIPVQFSSPAREVSRVGEDVTLGFCS